MPCTVVREIFICSAHSSWVKPSRSIIAMATGEPILDINGDPITLQPDSICVHGDTPGAVEIARQVREALEGAGVPLAPFAQAG